MLRLRNLHCEVRYEDGTENVDTIEIEIKIKDQDAHLLKNVSLIPFINTKNGPKYLCSSQYKTFKYFEFPSTALSYSDLPMIKNKYD